jgi:hypothetical protein
VIEWIRRALRGSESQTGSTSAGFGSTLYHWRCACGAHSRGGDPFMSDAEYNAQRHMWRQGVGHPMPEIYSTDEDLG